MDLSTNNEINFSSHNELLKLFKGMRGVVKIKISNGWFVPITKKDLARLNGKMKNAGQKFSGVVEISGIDQGGKYYLAMVTLNS